MPSQYPVLDDKPIDQWRVTELREELRRRKLVTKGLKEELVRRLDEAIQKEMESENDGELGNEIERLDEATQEEMESENDGELGNEIELSSDLPNNTKEDDVETEMEDDTQPLSDENNHTDNDGAIVDSSAVLVDVDQGTEDQNGDASEVTGLAGTDEDMGATADNLEDSVPCNQNVITQSGTCAEDAEHAEKYEEAEPPIEDSVVVQSELSHQVSEVSQDLGFQVKFESNCTDSVSFNEKNNIKDNLTADNFPLELKVMQEVVLPSSSSYPSNGGDTCMDGVEQETDKSGVTNEQEEDKTHVTDVQEDKSHFTDVQEDKSRVTDVQEEDKNNASDGEQEGQNLLSVEQGATNSNVANEQVVAQNHFEQEMVEQANVVDADLQNATNSAPSKKEDSIDAASPEKLNLDRSSGDESMEEDMLESKHMEVDIKSEELNDKTQANKVDVGLVGRAVADAVSQFSHDLKDIAVGHVKTASPTEKRKLEDEPVVGSNSVPKRQRRWNPDPIKVPDQQGPHVSISTTPKNSAQQTPRGTFSRPTMSADSPKERIVPTAKKPATTSLRIDNFLRPFTLKAVQELLAKTGKVCNFWMDHIKTHCYVTYSSVEEATETRNAIYNLQWPPNGGRHLAAEFVDPQEVKVRSEVPPQSPATPISPILATPKAPASQETQAPQPSRQQNLRQQPLPPPPPLVPPHPPMLSNPPPIARERLPPKKPEPPVVTLDDLFKKTRATPRIYYLPLTEDQVAAKLAVKGKSTQV